MKSFLETKIKESSSQNHTPEGLEGSTAKTPYTISDEESQRQRRPEFQAESRDSQVKSPESEQVANLKAEIAALQKKPRDKTSKKTLLKHPGDCIRYILGSEVKRDSFTYCIYKIIQKVYIPRSRHRMFFKS